MNTCRLSDELKTKIIRQNNICFVFCCLLLISLAGCSAPRPGEAEALKQIDKVIEWQMAKEENQLQEDKVLVVLYLDADQIEDFQREDSPRWAEYRCYSLIYRGYSGTKNVPVGAPWSTWEKIRPRDIQKEIVIDPGPPYKPFSKVVNLIPGQVTNLGYIFLEKVKYEGTVSITGIVTDEYENPLQGVQVYSDKGVSITDPNGRYRIDGFELDIYDVTAQKAGYIPVKTKFEIRDMEIRTIEQNIKLSLPRKIRLRYVVTPKDKNDFTDPAASSGTVEFLVDKTFMDFPTDTVESPDFRLFLKQTGMRIALNNGRLTLSPYYMPIFFERLRSDYVDFESIKGVGNLDDNTQRCPPIDQGDILLIAGGKRGDYTVSDYMVKILFEQIEPVFP